MLRKEVCDSCGLTKKAVEYYVTQRLIAPATGENGYRMFSEADVERLKKIAVLRGLDVAVEQIREILNAPEPKNALHAAVEAGARALERSIARQSLLEELGAGADWGLIQEKLNQERQRRTAAEKLAEIFPGYVGKYISLHFGGFLKDPIETLEQERAFAEIVEFIDRTEVFTVPPELEAFMDEMEAVMQVQSLSALSEGVEWAVGDIDAFICDNRAWLEEYAAFRQTEEFRDLPACRLSELLRTFQESSGYNTVLIPALEKLSPSYRNYRAKMEAANAVFLEKYPQAGAWT